MNPAPGPVVLATAAETRTVESRTIEQAGVAVEVLMERAATGVAAVAARQAEQAGGRGPIALLAGPGHNGGDAAACARILAGWGFAPILYASSGPCAPLTERQVLSARAYGVEIRPLSEFGEATVVVDGLLGFGLDRPPEGEIARAIDRMNSRAGGAVVAIDLPSGTHADTGVAPGSRVVATHTVATGLVKLGVACDPAVDAVGELWLADLAFPASELETLAGRVLVSEPLPERSPSSHKGTAGTALVVGGSAAMSGAPALMAQAAYRAGAGLVIVLVPGAIRDAVAVQVPEALVVSLPDRDGFVAPDALDAVRPYLSRATAIAVGPGLGRAEGPSRLARELAALWQGPLALDADALDFEPAGLRRRGPTVLAPHPGEAGRLLGRRADPIQADRLASARELANRFAATVVLKGARTLVARPDGRYAVLLRTTSALATAGSGDVLTGLVVGLLAQGLDGPAAAERGVTHHADLGLAVAGGSRSGGLMARDLLNYSGIFREPLAGPLKVGSSAIRLA